MNTSTFLQKTGATQILRVRQLMSSYPYCMKVIWPKNEAFYSLCYTRGESEIAHPVVRECNGLILEAKTNNVICYSIDVPDELSVSDAARIGKQKGWNIARVIPDGSLIKLYKYDGVWRTGTTKVPDANDANWYGPNFHVMFMECVNKLCPDLLDKLDSGFTYSWLMCHPQNRIVDSNT